MKTKTTRVFGISLGILLALSFVLAPFSAAASGNEGDGLAASVVESLVEDGEAAGQALPEEQAEPPQDPTDEDGSGENPAEDTAGAPGEQSPEAESPAPDVPDDGEKAPDADTDEDAREDDPATPELEKPEDSDVPAGDEAEQPVDQPAVLPARDKDSTESTAVENTDAENNDSEASESLGAYVSAGAGLPARVMPAMAMLPFPEDPADYSGEVYANSFADLQAKVTAAGQGDVIVLTGDIDFTDTITVDGGKEILIDGGGNELTGSMAGRLFDVRDATLELRSLTMDGNNTVAGISASNAALVLADVTATGFTAEYGGFLYATNSHVRTSTVRLEHNNASKDGGAVWMRGGSLWLAGTTIEYNTAGRNGGGVYVYETDVQSAGAGLDLAGNTAAQYGGGMYIDGTAGGQYRTVTYHVNGGEAATPVQHIYVFSGHVYVADADTLGFAPDSTLLEGTFEGWNTEPDGTGTGYAPGQLEELTGDLTLYAQWMYTSAMPVFDTVTEGDTEVTGTGIPGSVIEVTFPDGAVETTVVDEDGAWSVPYSGTPLVAGEMLYATQKELGKRVSAVADTVVQVSSVSEISEPPVFDDVYEHDGTVSGNGIAGAQVTVTFPSGATRTATVGATGRWSVMTPAGDDLQVGDQLYANQTEQGKLTSNDADTTVLARPQVKSEAPEIDEIWEDATDITGRGIAGSTVNVYFPNGSQTDVLVQPDNTWSVPVNGTLSAGQEVYADQTEVGKTVSDRTMTIVMAVPPTPANEKSDEPIFDLPIYTNYFNISGTGVPGAIVYVQFPNGEWANVPVDGIGKWSVAVQGPLFDGAQITAHQIEPGKDPSDTVYVFVASPTRHSLAPATAGVILAPRYATLGAGTAYVKLLDDEVRGNSAGLDGGGIYTVDYKYLYAEGVLFDDNTVTANPGGVKLDLVHDNDLVGVHDTQMVGLAGLSAGFNFTGGGNTRFAYNSIDVNYQAPVFHTITYKPGEGTGNDFSDSVRAGNSTTVAGAGSFTAPAGKKFSHWASGGATYKPGASLTPTGSMTLTAVWVRDDSQYASVTYHANGGEKASGGFADGHSESVLKGATHTVKQNGYARSGYTFTGWNTKADGTGTAYAAGKSITVSRNITLYAQWKQNQTATSGGDDSKPDSSKPDSSKPASSKPDSSRPDSSKPADSKPDSSRPAGSSSGGGASSKPAGSSEPGSSAGSSSSRRGYASSSEAPAPSRGSTPSETPPPPITTVAPSTSAASATSASTSVASSTSSTSQTSSATSPALADVSTPAPGGDGEGGEDGGETPPTVVDDTPAPGEAASSPADLPATATREEIIDATGSVDLFGNELPLGALNLKGGWSLVSLLVSVLSIILAVVYGVRTFVGRGNGKDEDDEAAPEAADGRTVYTRREKADQARAERREETRRRVHPRDIIAMVLGLLPVVVFLFMNDMANPMVLLNRSTLICAILALLHIGTFVAGQVLRRRQAQDEEDPTLDEA